MRKKILSLYEVTIDMTIHPGMFAVAGMGALFSTAVMQLAGNPPIYTQLLRRTLFRESKP